MWNNIAGLVPNLSISNSVSIGEGCHITCANKIYIGDNTLLGKYVTITDNSHGDSCIEQIFISPSQRPLTTKGPVVIGKRVWIGDKATILPNVTIGNGAIVGANSVVTNDIPDNTVCVGNPARVIKYIG